MAFVTITVLNDNLVSVDQAAFTNLYDATEYCKEQDLEYYVAYPNDPLATVRANIDRLSSDDILELKKVSFS